MSTLSLRLPESLHRQLSDLAEREGGSINQLISAAVGEKMSALMTEEYLAMRAKRGATGGRKAFRGALARVPGAEPVDADRLSSPAKKKSQRPGRRPAVRR